MPTFLNATGRSRRHDLVWTTLRHAEAVPVCRDVAAATWLCAVNCTLVCKPMTSVNRFTSIAVAADPSDSPTIDTSACAFRYRDDDGIDATGRFSAVPANGSNDVFNAECFVSPDLAHACSLVNIYSVLFL